MDEVDEGPPEKVRGRQPSLASNVGLTRLKKPSVPAMQSRSRNIAKNRSRSCSTRFRALTSRMMPANRRRPPTRVSLTVRLSGHRVPSLRLGAE
ncbi:MAG: hypothetical protein NDI82_13125, partial [Anaeromyxobacteraceae bacterium]|nr:hypothetical protein [Anaeromyxobacteraceae bacterium]